MRCAGFVLSVAVLAEHDDSAGLLQKKKKLKNQKIDFLKSDSHSCAAYGDPHFQTFDGQTLKAHCYGPLGDYHILKTDKLLIEARYKGVSNANSERNQVSAGIAVIQGVTVSGPLVDGAVISIPAMEASNYKLWMGGDSTISGPAVLTADGETKTGLDLVCQPYNTWRINKCFSKEGAFFSIVKNWTDQAKIWDDEKKDTVAHMPASVAAGRSERRAAFKAWAAHTCNHEEYALNCPKTVQFPSFTVQHGPGPMARVVTQPCEGELTEAQNNNILTCGHCKCTSNSWTIDVPNIATIVVNQGANQGIAVTIHDKAAVASDGTYAGQCGNFNGDAEDDAFDKWNCPYMISPPLTQVDGPDQLGTPSVAALQSGLPPLLVMQGHNPQANMVVERPNCAEVAQFEVHCKRQELAEDLRIQCIADCCNERKERHLGLVCGIDGFDPPPVEEEPKPCQLNNKYHAIVETKCKESAASDGFDGDKAVEMADNCVMDCCEQHEQCPDRGDGGVYVECFLTNKHGIKPFDHPTEDPNVNFRHNDYWLMESEALSVQGRFSSSDPVKFPRPSLTGIAITGYLLGDPRPASDDVEATADKWPVIEVNSKLNGVTSVVIDGLEHTSDVSTKCYKVIFGSQPSVLDTAAVVPGVYSVLQTNSSEHADSVLVIIEDCLFNNGELAGITINNHDDGTQDVIITTDTALTDLSAGFTTSLLGYCGNADGNLENDNPEDDSPQELYPESSLFSAPHPTVGQGCLRPYMLHEQNKKCPYNNNARLFRIDVSAKDGESDEEEEAINRCFLECSTHDECTFFSFARPESEYANLCMGCAVGVSEGHVGFDFFQICDRVTTTTTTTTTSVFVCPGKGYSLVAEHTKCDYQKENRMTRLEEEDEQGCYNDCAADEKCKFFSIGGPKSSHPGVCMGCDGTTNRRGEAHTEFTFFEMCRWGSDRHTCPKHVHHRCLASHVIEGPAKTDWRNCSLACQSKAECEWWAFNTETSECEVCRESFGVFQGAGGLDSKWDTFTKTCSDEAILAALHDLEHPVVLPPPEVEPPRVLAMTVPLPNFVPPQAMDLQAPDANGNARRSPVAQAAHDENPALSMCQFTDESAIIRDCTNKDMFEWKGGVHDNAVWPNYSALVYGDGPKWKTFDAAVEANGWSAACVAYTSTRGQTCKDWCEKTQTMTCVRGMDDAHHQTQKLTEWLQNEDYNLAEKYGGCTIVPSGHGRRSQEENGCLQAWQTQICACV